MNSSLKDISTRAPKDFEKENIKEKTRLLKERMFELQNILYSERKHSLLIILQGMDASGKDGAVRKVFSGINPAGCRVTSFKAPTEEELAHDFLWRIHKHTPAKGMIQIFNRSHYEDILITRVHGWITDDVARQRMEDINAFESLLQKNNTHILKFFLHISRDEQQKRFEERVTDPDKKWKHNERDLEEAKQWDKYREAYQEAINNCSENIPWIITPADQNWYKEYLIAKTITEKLASLDLKLPEPKE